MRKKLSILLLTILASSIGNATELIKIYSPYSPGHSATPALFRIVDEANM